MRTCTGSVCIQEPEFLLFYCIGTREGTHLRTCTGSCIVLDCSSNDIKDSIKEPSIYILYPLLEDPIKDPVLTVFMLYRNPDDSHT